MSTTLLNSAAASNAPAPGAGSNSNTPAAAATAFQPARRPFTHASTFSSGMNAHSSLPAPTSALRNVRVFDADAEIDHVTAQLRSDLQKTARQVRLSVSRGYCISTPQHTRSNSFASTTAPSSDHPGVDGPSTAASVTSNATDMPFGRASAQPWSRTQSAPVVTFSRSNSFASSAGSNAYYNDFPSADFRANELQPYASRPQRLCTEAPTSQSAFLRTSTTRSQHRARFADDEDGDITAISIEPHKDNASIDGVLGAHFEADEEFDTGFAISRDDREPSSSDDENGNGTSQSEGEDEDEDEDEHGDGGDLLSVSAETAQTAASEASGAASPSKKKGKDGARAGQGPGSRFPLSTRPNGLASKTTSLPAGPFDAANRIDDAFARRTVLRQGLENRTRTVAAVPAEPTAGHRARAAAAAAAAAGQKAEGERFPWTDREFTRWTSSSEGF